MSILPVRAVDRVVWGMDGRSVELWVLAVACFGLGDVATTAAGLTTGQLVEVGLLAAPASSRFGVGALVGLKLATGVLCLAGWRRAPRPGAVGIPLGLAAAGLLVTGWNASLLLSVR